MSIFNKSGKIGTNIKLVSLHIPKTAGTSFRNILKEVYGEEHVARLDIRDDIELNDEIFTGSRLSSDIKVIHGHFSFHKLKDHFRIKEKTPVITWLREPSERVISNFFYLEEVLKRELNEEEKGLHILEKMQKTLLEYAATEINRNRIAKFLEGISPEDFFFVGLTSNYEEDLNQLSSLLGWKDFPTYMHNATENKPIVDKETIDRIKELNREDYEIYNKVLLLREERMKQNA